jgi:quinol monooxygenase YgiN
MPVAVVARIRAKSGCERQLEQAIRSMIAKAREKGAAPPHYALYRSHHDPAVLVLWELYSGQAVPDLETEAEDTTGLAGELKGLIEGRPLLETLIDVEGD